MNNENLEVASPAESGVNPWFLLGCLRGHLKAGESITVNIWNEAVLASKEDAL